MKEKQIILSIVILQDGKIKDQVIETFDAEYKTKEFIDGLLTGELESLKRSSGHDGLYIRIAEGNIRDLWDKREGTLTYVLADREYHVRFVVKPAIYSVTDDEVVTVLDSFANSGRSPYVYQDVAKKISVNMHRYCQNELWKFVKAIIRAFAEGRCDERNAVAKEQATAVQDFISSNLK